MREQLEKRRADLQAEYERGQQALDNLQQQTRTTEQTMLRIHGALLLLDELLAGDEPDGVDNGDNS